MKYKISLESVLNERPSELSSNVDNNKSHVPTLHSPCPHQSVQTSKCPCLFGNLAFNYFALQFFSFLRTLIKTLYSSRNVIFVCLQKIVTHVTTSLPGRQVKRSVICCYQHLKTDTSSFTDLLPQIWKSSLRTDQRSCRQLTTTITICCREFKGVFLWDMVHRL